ncbi:O-acetyl-ADP-ribose deacetylase [compost metagenome]
MIKVIKGDLTKAIGVDYIVNAANGVGPMGSGIAGAIRRAGGVAIQQQAFAVCSKADYQPGDIYVTTAGELSFKKIIHLVTMKNPGGVTSLEIVEKCLKNLVSYCELANIKKVGLPALGTGVGKLDLQKVASLFVDILGPIKDTEFSVVDIDPIFIYHVNREIELRLENDKTEE